MTQRVSRFYGPETDTTSEFLGVSPHRFENDPALISECAFDVRKGNRDTGKRVCSSPVELRAMKHTFGAPSTPTAATTTTSGRKDEVDDEDHDHAQLLQDAHHIVEHSKKQTDCPTEACVISHPRMAAALGGAAAVRAAEERLFVPLGHFDNALALPDDHIANLLRQWRRTYTDYVPIPFQMIDFADQPRSALRTFDFARELLQGGKRCFSVIINTDKTGGRGKHWFCMFFDFRALSDADVTQLARNAAALPAQRALVHRFTRSCTIEYFNSSARAVPYAEIQQFGQQLVKRLLSELPGINVHFVTAARSRQQYSKSECGMYSLVYIWRRLEGVPFTHFLLWRITDEDMHVARRHFWRGPGPRRPAQKMSFDTFNQESRPYILQLIWLECDFRSASLSSSTGYWIEQIHGTDKFVSQCQFKMTKDTATSKVWTGKWMCPADLDPESEEAEYNSKVEIKVKVYRYYFQSKEELDDAVQIHQLTPQSHIQDGKYNQAVRRSCILSHPHPSQVN